MEEQIVVYPYNETRHSNKRKKNLLLIQQMQLDLKNIMLCEESHMQESTFCMTQFI